MEGKNARCISISERPKQEKLVSAETEISAKMTEISAEISAETLPNKLLKNYVKWGFDFKFFFPCQVRLMF